MDDMDKIEQTFESLRARIALATPGEMTPKRMAAHLEEIIDLVGALVRVVKSLRDEVLKMRSASLPRD